MLNEEWGENIFQTKSKNLSGFPLMECRKCFKCKIMKWFVCLAPLVFLLASCAEYGKVGYRDAPKVINVSEYDPKERQRSGSSYTPLNQYALKKNGALGLIARCGKGTHIDTKCADFLQGAEAQGFLLGTYFYLLPSDNPTATADRYIARLQQIKRSRGLRTSKVLLCADIHPKCSAWQIVTYLKRIKQRTGVTPVVYLENSDSLRSTLNNASRSQKSFLRKHPYWLALYSDKSARFPTPQKLAEGSGIWSNWVMWQYGGVWWKNGRSNPYYYRGGNWQTPKYFGDLSQPTERNGFNGSKEELYAFWNKHSWAW